MSTKQGNRHQTVIQSAAGQGQSGPPSDCENCTKKGLAILPVVSAPALKSLHQKFATKAQHAEALRRLDGRLNAQDRSESWDFMRALLPGYVYVLKPNNTWDAYVVGGDGLLKKMPVAGLDGDAEAVKLSSCTRAGHSNFNPQFFCVDPALGEVWIAYSKHAWTPAVRDRFKNNTDGCRDQRMTRLDLVAAARGNVGSGTAQSGGVPYAALASEGMLQGIADYGEAEFVNRLSGELIYPLHNRAGQAGTLAQRMSAASATVESKQGIVLVLNDAVLVAEELNQMRLRAVQGHQDWMAGGADAAGVNADIERPWKRQSATHVAYLEAWAASVELDGQKKSIGNLRGVHRDLHKSGSMLGAMTEAQFNERYRVLSQQPLRRGNGLNPYHKARWVPIRNSQGRPVASGLGHAELHQDYWDALAEHHAKHRTANRLERMHERLRIAELQAFNAQYESQEKAWGERVAALDRDYVAFVRQSGLQGVLRHDFEDDKDWASARSAAAAVQVHMRDTLARLQATERALGGAAVSEHSLGLLKEYVIDMGVAEADNWIGKALAGDFGFAATVQREGPSAGTAPDLYEIALGAVSQGNAEGREAWMQLWQAYREQAHASAQNLVLPIQQLINQLRMKALADAGGDLARAASALEALNGREVVWVRVAALQEFLATTKRHYSIKVRWNAGAFLDAHATAFDTPAFDLDPRDHGSRTAVRSQMRQARKQLKLLANDPRFAQMNLTVPLLVDSTALQRRAGKAGEKALEVFSDDLLGGKQLPSTLPESVVEQLVQRRPAGRASALTAVKSREGVFTAFALLLSAREFWAALGGIGKSGFEHADAVASMASAISGILGGAAEVGAMVMQSAVNAGTQSTGAVTAAAFSRALFWRLGAGILGAAGAGADAGSAFVKAKKASDSGNYRASNNFVASGLLLSTSGASSLGGAFITWRSALAARAGLQVTQLLGRQAAIGLARGVAVRTAAGALLGASLTGVGLVLFAAGIIWALYAQSLEDDDNEQFLRRSYWGTREPESQPLGGVKPTEKPAIEEWHMIGIDAEMQALGNLALGFKGEITDWNGEWFANDIIEFKFRFGSWDATSNRLEYKLHAYPNKDRSGTPVLLREGPHPHEVPVREDEVLVLEIAQTVDDDRFESVKLQFAVFKDDEQVGSDGLWATIND